MATENKTYFAKAASETGSFGYKDIFSGVLVKHSKADMDRSFSAGLFGHIPEGAQLLDGWQKPWLFSRFLVYGLLAWLITAIFAKAGHPDGGSMLLVATSVIPMSLTLFFWEMNIPRNIPIYEILKLFLYGGIGTTVVWNFVNVLFDTSELSEDSFSYWFVGAAVVEEITKLILVAIALRKIDYCWGLNGLAIGAAVGCGFAVFETVTYVFIYLRDQGVDAALDTLTARGITTINGHVAWAAMYGGALALAKGREKLQAKHFVDSTFLITFISSLLLHGAFDYYDSAVIKLFGESNPELCRLILDSGVLTYIIHAVIFAIPTYALILWVMRKSVRQVVTAAQNPAPIHHNQVVAAANAGNYAAVHQPVGNVRKPAAPLAGNVLILECVSGELSGTSYSIEAGRTFTIGRGAQNNIQYSDGSKGISRNHCSVSFDGSSAVVTDIGSSHGTFLANGTKMQPKVPHTLRNGDTFFLASQKDTFRVTIR